MCHIWQFDSTDRSEIEMHFLSCCGYMLFLYYCIFPEPGKQIAVWSSIIWSWIWFSNRFCLEFCQIIFWTNWFEYDVSICGAVCSEWWYFCSSSCKQTFDKCRKCRLFLVLLYRSHPRGIWYHQQFLQQSFDLWLLLQLWSRQLLGTCERIRLQRVVSDWLIVCVLVKYSLLLQFIYLDL